MPPGNAVPRQSLGLTSVLVREYDEAIAFYVNVLGFSLVEDTLIPEQAKRWVVVAPPGAQESRLLLARAVGSEQESRVGNQTGGRVLLFLRTNDFGATTNPTSQEASASFEHRRKKHSAPSPCFGTSTATSGISCSAGRPLPMATSNNRWRGP
jgi:catechol 2,3-dioxygenase-like lactoylglutathione lyase family enzyme